MQLLWLFISNLFFSAVFAAPATGFKVKRDFLPTQPSDDSFYSPPPGFESQPLGAILKSRKQDHTFGIVVIPEKIEGAYQYLVRSEDSFGNPIAAVATLFIPKNADPNKLLSYQVAEDASNINCSPSYAMQLGSNPDTIVTAQIEQLLVQGGLNQGWYVVVPDHEGPKSTFVAAHSAGKIVLNAIRAVIQTSNTTGLSSNPTIALWGYSGGSLGTEWGAMYHKTYAPELNIVGAALGGIIVDIDHIARFNLGTIFAGFVITAINGLSHEYSALNDYITNNVFPSQLDYFRKTNTICLLGDLLSYPFAKLEQFISVGINALDDPIVKNVTSSNNALLSDLVPDIPLFFYDSLHDEIVPASDTDLLYNKWCSQGVSISYRQDEVGGHITQAVLGAGDAFEFVKARLNGTPAPQGCNKVVAISNVFSLTDLDGLGSIIVAAIKALFLQPLGPFWMQ
ncbi:lipase 1 [[Candida] anglica]|uniref:Lipase 1 n=1 Tax=[Candida] anglica TaxID=148631 RepID=A0ABP0EEI9_9ASCO